MPNIWKNRFQNVCESDFSLRLLPLYRPTNSAARFLVSLGERAVYATPEARHRSFAVVRAPAPRPAMIRPPARPILSVIWLGAARPRDPEKRAGLRITHL